MKQLFTIDAKDYDPAANKFYRPSVRGIIFDAHGSLALIYSRKYHFYKFPGGGIEGNETHLETLAREIKEETGLTLIPGSAHEFGEVLRMQNGKEDNTIFVQQNFYYTCAVEDKVGEQKLDDDEQAMDFVLKYVSPKEAIATNKSSLASNAFLINNTFKAQMIKRETRVLELLATENLGNQ